MGLYSKQGLYAGYKKNNKEREALDYYATPPQEVTNILEALSFNMDGCTILEPCAGEGHMIKGIEEYLKANGYNAEIKASDVMPREHNFSSTPIRVGKEMDFLADDYPYNEADYVIMNPPFTTIEPFVIRASEIAKKGLLMFGRIQFLEGQGRYENILKDNPPSEVYIYVDRIKCGKNGDFANTEAIQAYAWYYWDRTAKNGSTKLHWIRRK